MNACVLIVEDDRELLRLLQLDLERNSHDVLTAVDGQDGLRMFQANTPDLVVMDVALPGMNGLELCQRIREKSDVPILMMTAHAVSEEEIAEGLDSGADEYMLKPFGNIEFHARVRALLRRASLAELKEKQLTGYDDGHLKIDLTTRRVKIDAREIRLTPTEFNLLATFIQHRGEVLTFGELLEQVWGVEYKNEHHYPRIYVSHLRRKIEPDIKNPTYIHNEYGVGYRFVARKIH
ncbi:MAG: response regulator transcription factor [Chitinophagaceae bacterium]|nr:response regulator transcription factor [Anaerolineae bacterium]